MHNEKTAANATQRPQRHQNAHSALRNKDAAFFALRAMEKERQSSREMGKTEAVLLKNHRNVLCSKRLALLLPSAPNGA